MNVTGSATIVARPVTPSLKIYTEGAVKITYGPPKMQTSPRQARLGHFELVLTGKLDHGVNVLPGGSMKLMDMRSVKSSPSDR